MLKLVYYLIMLVTLAICLAVFFTAKNRIKNNKFFKIVSLVLAGIFCVRYFYSGDVFSGVVAFDNSPISTNFLTALSVFCVWFEYACLILLMLYPFFKNEILIHTIKFFALPVALLNAGAILLQIQGLCYNAPLQNFNVKALFLCFEIAIVLSYAIYVFFAHNKFKSNKQNWFAFLGILVPMLLCCMPNYTLQVLFGNGNVIEEVKGFSVYHRLVLYFSIILPFIIYFLLKKRSKQFIKLCLLFISLGTLITFARRYTFANFLMPNTWPLHLCNTAMFIVPLCIIFKLNKLFYFTLFINVFGAFIAMAIPNYSEVYMFSNTVVGFWFNHYCAFFMPILIMALGLYEKPKLKQFIYSLVGFAMYFVLVLVVNALFSNLGSVDFFFINSDFVAKKLGKWAENLRNIDITFAVGNWTITLYPVYQFLYFLVYGLLGLSMWFVYEQFFAMFEIHGEMSKRKEKIKLDKLAMLCKLDGKGENEPMFEQAKSKLIIKDLTKKYGNSEVYAVYKANLEVNGGEIFGFLGPNGAGKSTIIKSIVGIQPITDGEIIVCGYDADKQSVMAKRQIGFVPDHYALYEKLTGREYVNYIADLYDVSKKDRDERIEKYVKLFELENAFDNHMKTYSHGMKQKITIISALVHNPKVWILDEPLTGLDPNSIFQVKECMKEHAKNGNIVFFSSHIIDVVEKICDRIAIIKKGQICTVKTIKELEEQGIDLEKFYLEEIENKDKKAIKVEKKR